VEQAEFRDLALAEFDAVYRMAFSLARNPTDAADLTQETYLKAFKAEGRFELRDHGIRPWLFKILHNTFYTKVSKDQRRASLSDDLSYHPDPASDGRDQPAWDLTLLDWEQVDERLKAAIDELPEHYRQPLLLWAVEGLKYREIADVLDVKLGTVMSRLYRARGILTESLADLAAEQGIGPMPEREG